jgi:tetratricopeptide (TPR) repeat protein
MISFETRVTTIQRSTKKPKRRIDQTFRKERFIVTPQRATALFLLAALSISCGTVSDNKSQAPEATGSIPLFDNLGSYHRTVTTTSEQVQKYFDQGLRFIYAFNHDEAARAFREAVRIDPSCAMAWWGIAYALGPNYNLPMDPKNNASALEAVQKAQSLQSQASEPERAYISAIATRYSADPKADRAELNRVYGEAMKALYQKYPDDSDAGVLYAESLMNLKPWQLWSIDGKPAEGTTEIVKVLETILARDPNHPGANHYYIHAIEASPSPEKGLASADRLKSLVPGAGHLVHMPAHIFIRTGDYQGAIEANANAASADEAYFARTNKDGMYPVMYDTHNFQFLATAAAMIGQCGKALDAAAKAVKYVASMAGHDPMAEYALPWSTYVMARCMKWDEILASPRPADNTPATLAFWHYARGLAQVAKRDLNAARKERDDFIAVKSKISQDLMLNLNRAQDLLSIAASVLEARLSSAAGDSKSAIGHWSKAVEIQDRLIYDEPPAWYFPVRESLGGEYLRQKQYGEAEKVFRRDLELNPKNPRSLLGLREALRLQSKEAEAGEMARRFEDFRKDFDIAISVEGL